MIGDCQEFGSEEITSGTSSDGTVGLGLTECGTIKVVGVLVNDLTDIDINNVTENDLGLVECPEKFRTEIVIPTVGPGEILGIDEFGPFTDGGAWVGKTESAGISL